MKVMIYPERKGYERGVKQGIEKGIEKREIGLLSHVLKHRFGDLPAEVLETLQAGTSKQILVWTDVALDADSLQDVFT